MSSNPKRVSISKRAAPNKKIHKSNLKDMYPLNLGSTTSETIKRWGEIYLQTQSLSVNSKRSYAYSFDLISYYADFYDTTMEEILKEHYGN